MKKLILAFAIFPIVALGCSGSSSQDESGDNGADNGGTSGTSGTGGTGTSGSGGNDGVTGFITSYCAALTPCCAAAGLPTDGVQCRALLTALVGGSDYTFDQAAANECAAWLTANGASICQNTSATPPVCSRIFLPTGSATPGQSCVSGGDCALSPEGEVQCLGTSPDAICQLKIKGTEGSAPCAWSERDGVSTSSSNFDLPRVYSCSATDGLRCDGNACVRLTAQGGACVSTEECASGTFCSPEGGCQPLLPVGAVCKFYDQCLRGQCTNQVCVANSGDAGIGLLCGGN